MSILNDLIPKVNPSQGRDALLQALIDAHTDPDTGGLVCGERQIYAVAHRLGRHDLNFGAEWTSLGQLTGEEWVTLKEMIRLREKRANSKRRLFSDKGQSPLYKKLSQVEKLIFQALDKTGRQIWEPSAATTLAQAALEGWFDVPTMILTPLELLREAAKQGDSHAAFLLGTFSKSTDGNFSSNYLIKDVVDREKYLNYAVLNGHKQAADLIEDKAFQHEMYDDVKGDIDYEEFIDEYRRFPELEKMAFIATGEKLFQIALELEKWIVSFLFDCPQGKVEFYVEDWKTRKAICYKWLKKAAEKSTNARRHIGNIMRSPTHILHGSTYIAETNVKTSIDYLKEAAWPESELNPCHSALIDLACMLVPKESDIHDAVQGKKCIDQALRHLEGFKASEIGLLAGLHEKCYEKSDLVTTISLYQKAGITNPHHTFRAALLSLRVAGTPDEIDACKKLFEYCAKQKVGFNDSPEFSTLSKVAIEIGWGGKSFIDGEPQYDWNDATFQLIKIIYNNNISIANLGKYFEQLDIEKLLSLNTSLTEYSKLVRDDVRFVNLTELDLKPHEIKELKDRWEESEVSENYVYGSGDPTKFIRGLAAIIKGNRVDPTILVDEFSFDVGTVFSEFLLGSMHLSFLSEQDSSRTKALEHFIKGKSLFDRLILEHGARGLNIKSEALIWIEPLLQRSIVEAQPNTITHKIGERLNGPVNLFGEKLMGIVLGQYPNATFPGLGIATGVIYNDSFINTPIKIVILTNWLAAVKRALEANNRWSVQHVEIATSTDMKQLGEPPRNLFNRVVWEKAASRNTMIEDCLKEVGLHAEVANRQSDHARGLYIDFDDGSRFSLWLDAGVSHWHAADGSNHLFPVGVPPWTQAERLSVVQVPILMDKHKPVLAHSEWTKQPRAKDQIS